MTSTRSPPKATWQFSKEISQFSSQISLLKAELTAELALEIDALRGTMTDWMFTQSLAIFAAIVGVAFLT